MTYRDRELTCPRCGVALARVDTSDRWTCARCHGTLADVGVVIRELLVVAPSLAPADGVGDVTTMPRKAPPELACPLCNAPMDPAFLGAREIDRCRADNLLWFDRDELTTILYAARTQKPRSWLAMFFGDLP